MPKELDLCDPDTLQAVARRAGLIAKRNFSQNFLIDRDVRDGIVDALDPQRDDVVLEIGPGVGTLTGALAARSGRVIAVDIDEACVRATQETQSAATNVQVINADAVQMDIRALDLPNRWLVAGNLPYHLTGAIIQHLFEQSNPPVTAVFLLQREVAARLAAETGKWSLATVAVRSLAYVECIRDVPPSSFDPEPKVFSSVVRMTPAAPPADFDRPAVLKLAKAAFQMRRKTLRHGIGNALGGDEELALVVLKRSDIDSSRRPGTLTLEEWGAVAQELQKAR